MAYGDKKVMRISTSYSSVNWDANDRALSKMYLDKVKAQGVAYLEGLAGDELLRLKQATSRISRYGNYDWERIKDIVGQAAIDKANEKITQVRVEQRKKSDERRLTQYQRDLNLKRDMMADSRLMTGFVQTEIAQAVAYRERHDLYEGDWLDDPVAASLGQGGYGEEVRKSVGIRLQINICLDCSNSMYYNGLSEIAVETVRTMYMALDQASIQLPQGSLTVHVWKWAEGKDGKGVTWVTNSRKHTREDNPLGHMEYLPGNYLSAWSGEDTWIYPLLDRLDQWENTHGDPGAYRLDIVISDGMLEHRTDASKGDVIQDRRDGNLQTVVLNFLPMEEWGEYRVPNRCVQYPATPENLLGLMRQVLGDWLVGI